jgi:hypothetical protein
MWREAENFDEYEDFDPAKRFQLGDKVKNPYGWRGTIIQAQAEDTQSGRAYLIKWDASATPSWQWGDQLTLVRAAEPEREIAPDDPAVLELWPDYLPWGEAEQDYYRGAAWKEADTADMMGDDLEDEHHDAIPFILDRQTGQVHWMKPNWGNHGDIAMEMLYPDADEDERYRMYEYGEWNDMFNDTQYVLGRLFDDGTIAIWGRDDNENDLTPEEEQKVRAEVKLTKMANWNDIMEKAQRYRSEGRVILDMNSATDVVGRVYGDTARENTGQDYYETTFSRQDPNSNAITQWQCSCPWDDYAWQRTRQWKKYEGRPCAHVLALHWESQTQPLDEDTPEAQGQEQLFNPALFSPAGPPMPGGPNAGPIPVQQPATPAVPAVPATSQPTQPGQDPLGIPGAFSHVKWAAAFRNGDIIMARENLWGEDRDGNGHTVPMNTGGEVLWSDPENVVAIFPLETGELEPHLIRVECTPNQVAINKKLQPFIKRKR